ncbi:MAG: methyltransferase domain-containing protein [Clostridiales bacterium]|nr:methyltransferase domain-containing protein [Clostridiales bacterium]
MRAYKDNNMDTRKEININDEYTTRVIDMTAPGEGICRCDGAAVFLPGGVTGDLVRLRIAALRRRRADGELLEILEPSPRRVSPDCPVYGDSDGDGGCGGCTLRHVDPDYGASVRENLIRAALRREGVRIACEDRAGDYGVCGSKRGVCVDCGSKRGVCGDSNGKSGDVRPILRTREIGYRNKVTFHIGSDGLIGFYAPSSHRILPGSHLCPLCPGIFGRIARFTMDAIASSLLPLPDGGGLELRISAAGFVRVILGVPAGYKGDLSPYAAALVSEFGAVISGVLSAAADRRGRVEYTLLRGERWLDDTIGGVPMRLSPGAFAQVNREGAAHLADIILRYAEEYLTGGDAVSGGSIDDGHGIRIQDAPGDGSPVIADLYCGSGFFGLALAKRFPSARVYGIELNPDSIADAEVNRSFGGLSNITFFCGDAAGFSSRVGEKPGIVVLDPPRAGLSDAMTADIVSVLSPPIIVYVSCNPSTLARDLARLCAAGYALREVQPVDMFPGTEHVETVCLLVRRNGLHINIYEDVEEMLQEKRGQATYPQIKEYVLEQTGMKVSSLYISQVKRKCGLEVGDSYNKPKSEDSRVPQCPPDKEKAIMDALKHFEML